MVGLVISLLCSEIFGVSPGGIITPSYLALVCDDVKLVVFVYLIAALSYAVVAFAQRHFVRYGRRKFVFTIVVAVTLRAILGFAYPFLPFEALILHGIGAVSYTHLDVYKRQSVLFPVPVAPKMHSAPGDSYVSDNPSITGRPPP